MANAVQTRYRRNRSRVQVIDDSQQHTVRIPYGDGHVRTIILVTGERYCA